MALLLAVVGASDSNPVHAGSLTYEIKADTSGMIPGPGGLIDISLNPAIAQSPATVSARVFGPFTDGALGAATPVSGTAAGDLRTTGVTAGNSSPANELTQNFTVGSFFDVFVTLSGPEVGTGASGNWSGTVFTLGIFDKGSGYEQAQLIVNPNVNSQGKPIVDGTVDFTSGTTHPQVVVQLVPEPAGVVLMGLGAWTVVAVGLLRRRAS
jgi:hypothetical protein